jgi:hypothetical protein
VPAGGGAITNVGSPNAGTYIWVNATSDAFDNTGMSYNVAHTTSTGSVSVTVTSATGGPAATSLAAWGP